MEKIESLKIFDTNLFSEELENHYLELKEEIEVIKSIKIFSYFNLIKEHG